MIELPGRIKALPRSCFMGPTIEELTFEEWPSVRRSKAECFDQKHLKAICIPPLVEEPGEHCFYHARVGRVRIDPESELGRIEKSRSRGSDGEGLGLGCGDGPGSPEVELAPDAGDGIGVAEPVDVVRPLSEVVKGLAIGGMENEDDADGGSEVSIPDHADRPPAAASQMWSQTFSQSTSA
jgi:hypothetical protein